MDGIGFLPVHPCCSFSSFVLVFFHEIVNRLKGHHSGLGMRMFGKYVEFVLKSEHQKMPVPSVDLPKVVDPRAAAFVLRPPSSIA
jgi:hypothetical protein